MVASHQVTLRRHISPVVEAEYDTRTLRPFTVTDELGVYRRCNGDTLFSAAICFVWLDFLYVPPWMKTGFSIFLGWCEWLLIDVLFHVYSVVGQTDELQYSVGLTINVWGKALAQGGQLHYIILNTTILILGLSLVVNYHDNFAHLNLRIPKCGQSECYFRVNSQVVSMSQGDRFRAVTKLTSSIF